MKTASYKNLFCISIVLSFSGSSCTNYQFEQYFLSAMESEIPGGCNLLNISYDSTISPLLQEYCTGCHRTVSPGGGITIVSYGDLVALAGNGCLMGSIRYESGYAKMPTNQQLSDCNINLLQKWIQKGFPELQQLSSSYI